MIKKLKKYISLHKQKKIIRASGLFDTKYYLQENPDVLVWGIDPIIHYIKIGAKTGKRPNPSFCSTGYYNKNPDVKTKGINPLLHYILYGKNENRTWTSSANDDKNIEIAYPRKIIRFLEKIPPLANIQIPTYYRGRVLIVADMNLPQCKKYRVLQKVEVLGKLGVTAIYSSFMDTVRVVNNMQEVEKVIFYRVPSSNLLNMYMHIAQILGLDTFYDIDDPIFAKTAQKNNKNLNTLNENERMALIKSAEYYKKAIQSFQKIIVSTHGLMEKISILFPNKDILVWRNAVDEETKRAATSALRNTVKKEESITIFYGSGSRAHDMDFQIVSSVLKMILKKHENVQLLIAGYAQFDADDSQINNRVIHLPFSEIDDYMTNLASSDIAIIPLLMNEFNSCKSAIRYYEASCVGIPTIASKTGDFVNIIQDGRNGFLATTDAEWYNNLELLINSPKKRREIAKEATKTIYQDFTTEQLSQTIAVWFNPDISRNNYQYEL